MGRKYCCVPECHNTSDTIGQDEQKIILHRFPMSEKRAHIKKLWIQRLKNVRANLIVKDHTRVCSAHFDGLFTDDSIPTLFPTKPKKVETPRRPLVRIQPLNNTASNIDTVDSLHSYPVYTSKYIHACTQTDEPDSPVMKDSETNTDVFSNCNVECQTGSSFPSVNVEIQVELPRITVDDIRKDNNKVRFYTDFVSNQVFFMFFCTLLKHGADRLNYWEGEAQSMGDKPNQTPGVEKPGRKRFLRPIDEFLLVCMRLRLGLLQEFLSDLFRVSETTVSRIMNTWINFLYDHCLSLIAWPTRKQILCNMPRLYKDKSCIDCTEFFCEKPSSVSAQWMTWSEYKHSNTFKVLIGVAPNGMVTFVSRLWGGNVSDRHITQHDCFLPKLSPGDIVMADKGFTIYLLPPEIVLNVPPRVSTKCQMSSSEFYKTNSIASARIVVEMKKEQLKNYNIINSVLPISEAHLAEQIILICASLTNLLPPLLK